MKKTIVAIGAHLDDIELAAGGTLAKAVRDGHDVYMIVMSQSGYTDFNGKVMRTNETAIQEGRNAVIRTSLMIPVRLRQLKRD